MDRRTRERITRGVAAAWISFEAHVGGCAECQRRGARYRGRWRFCLFGRTLRGAARRASPLKGTW